MVLEADFWLTGETIVVVYWRVTSICRNPLSDTSWRCFSISWKADLEHNILAMLFIVCQTSWYSEIHSHVLFEIVELFNIAPAGICVSETSVSNMLSLTNRESPEGFEAVNRVKRSGKYHLVWWCFQAFLLFHSKVRAQVWFYNRVLLFFCHRERWRQVPLPFTDTLSSLKQISGSEFDSL